MTAGPGSPPPALAPVDSAGDRAELAACCSAVYASPLAEMLVGPSLHPGGLDTTQALLRAAGLPRGARLLDAGCGLGASAHVAEDRFGFRVEAVDASAAVVARAEARDPGDVVWRRADLLALPHPDGAFDGVLAECVLSTLPREAALAELRRVIRPGGVLALSDVVTSGPAPAAIAGGLLGVALCVGDAWQPGELEARLEAAGFSLERRWDRSEAIVEMVDRIEARLRIALAVARDSALDLSGMAASAGLGPVLAGGPDAARRLAEDVRGAVRRAELCYFAAIARAR